MLLQEEIKAEREGINASSNNRLKLELEAFNRLYPQLKDNTTLYEYKQTNNSDDLLSRYKQEVRIDKVYSYNEIMKRGANLLKNVDGDDISTFEKLRENLLSKNSKQKATKLVEEIELDSSIDNNRTRKFIKQSAVEFFQITEGKGASSIKSFQANSDRPYTYQNGKIDVGKIPSSNAVYHEMGHHIEFENSRIASVAREWRDRRATGEAQSLNNLVNDGKFSSREMAKPGKYFHPYVGKVYLDGNTEVVSMGIEKFTSAYRMQQFYNLDKEHFQFILGILREE